MIILSRFLRWLLASLVSSNNRRAAFFWVIVVLIGLGALLTGRFQGSWTERFQAKVPKSETLQKGHNILRGYGLKTDAELTKEQRSVFESKGVSWYIRFGRWSHKRLVMVFWIMVPLAAFYTLWAFRDEVEDFFIALFAVYQTRRGRSRETQAEASARHREEAGAGPPRTGPTATQQATGGAGQAGGTSGVHRSSPFWQILGADFIAEVVSKFMMNRRH